MLSHRYLARQGQLHARQFGFTAEDVLYCPFPLFHVDAATLTVVAALPVGGMPEQTAAIVDISAAEVEQLVQSHPDVLEAAAVGVPSELTEEVEKFRLIAPPPTTWDSEADASTAPARAPR